ncbi:ABC transporter substrate-binding protein [Vallitalea okinawensis]|uniref:ABC transporter substrate-binding protein n=1 Tax=Vallitalea okinawensis TaxID=2078660 RepID=UPI000CFBC271|nr:ABC transporter substrate-binding protein [Vallitalea okinawensis]
MKKRLLALLLAMVLVLSFAFVGCSSNEEPTDAPAKEESTDKPADKPAEEKKDLVVGDPFVVMDNVNARKAVAMSFDKSFITDELLANGSQPIDFFVPDGISSDSEGNGFRSKYPEGFNHYNPEEAVKLWETAKEEVGFDVVEIEFLTYDTENSRKIGEYIKEQIEKTLDGLTLVVNMQPFENKLVLEDEGKFQLSWAGWGPDYPDPMTFMDMWVTGGGHNSAKYENAEYDAIITSAKSGDLVTDIDARWDALQELENTLLGEDQVLVPLYQRTTMRLYQSYVDGIVRHNFGGDFTYREATSNEINGETVLRLAETSDIPSMDSSKATDSRSFEILANVLEGLYSLGENDVPYPSGAVSHEVSEDGLTYTFKLNEKSVWSNGTPVIADDYVYSWRRAADPATGAQYNFMLTTAGVANAEAVITGEAPTEELGITAIDDYTLEVKLDYPVPYFIKLMTFSTFAPINQEFCEAQGDAFGTSTDTVLYNGPYVLDAWEVGYSHEIAKNPTYYGADTVKLDRVTFRVVKDAASAIALYEDGEIDRVGLTAEYVEQYIDDPNLVLEPELVTFYLVFNINNHE